MKTITEKTDELVEELIYCDMRTEVGIDRAKKAVRRSLRKGPEEEQNRELRKLLKRGTGPCGGGGLLDEYHNGVRSERDWWRAQIREILK